MTTPTSWNDPKSTWKLASYQPPTERRAQEERPADPRRGTLGERRRPSRRSLRSLLRL